MRRQIGLWKLSVVLFIVTVGSALYITFEWTGYWQPMAPVAVVNESTWEPFWLALMAAFLVRPFIWARVHDYWAARSVAASTMPTCIAVLFYGYKAATANSTWSWTSWSLCSPS
jgi:hypothetical protein